MKAKHSFSQYLAEFIGTFFLVFFGCGSMVLASVDAQYNGAFIPIIWGGVVSIMIYATGHISGAHFNPAVTIAFWITRKFPSIRVPGYILSQVLGSSLACAVMMVIWGPQHDFGATMMSVELGVGFLVEVILSFALMFVIISVATDTRAVGELAGLAIGSTVAICAFVGGPLTKASMNPARSLGPSIFSGTLNQVWPFILAPIIGATLGALTYEWIRCHREDDKTDFGCC
ncbi:MAG: MIP/aquaporin family protein [Bacteriovoracaceae bacterium]